MNWQEICENPRFRDLPFKFETDRWGRIVMSPASNRHSLLQAEIKHLLRAYRADGYAFPECSIATTLGVKVADVAWASDAFLRRHGAANPYPEAPEIVAEVISASNSLAEMEEEKVLYFAQGACEVWLCQEDGALLFYSNLARLGHSDLVPGFPFRVVLPFL